MYIIFYIWSFIQINTPLYPRHSPIHIVVLISGIQLQFKSSQQVADHSLKSVVQDPVPQTGNVLAVGLHLCQHLMQASIYLVSLLVRKRRVKKVSLYCEVIDIKVADRSTFEIRDWIITKMCLRGENLNIYWDFICVGTGKLTWNSLLLLQLGVILTTLPKKEVHVLQLIFI